jgi:hypothetical protein
MLKNFYEKSVQLEQEKKESEENREEASKIEVTEKQLKQKHQ